MSGFASTYLAQSLYAVLPIKLDLRYVNAMFFDYNAENRALPPI